VKADIARFIRKLRAVLDAAGFAYAYVIERGTKGTRRLHVHLLTTSNVDASAVAKCWDYGRTDYSEPRGGVSKRGQSRRAAGYLSKYLGKSLGDEDELWAHSYERAEGFNVRQVKRRLANVGEVLWFMEQFLPGELTLSLHTEWSDYEGPPAFVVTEDWD
jgi:hypothetical protein